MRNRYFLMKNVLAHKTSKRKCKSIRQKHNKSNGKVKEIQRASILEPQNKQREPATQISIILILTQAKQHFSIQLGVRKRHRKALRNALPISQNSYKTDVNHLKWKHFRKANWHQGGLSWRLGSQISIYLCATYAPLMRRSYENSGLGILHRIGEHVWVLTALRNALGIHATPCPNICIKSVGRGNAITTYARSETHSCATHCA